MIVDGAVAGVVNVVSIGIAQIDVFDIARRIAAVDDVAGGQTGHTSRGGVSKRSPNTEVDVSGGAR